MTAGLALSASPACGLLHNLLMRFPDRPGSDASSDDVPRRAERRDAAQRLAERLLRLPAGHPSGADSGPAPAGGEPQEGDTEELVSHPQWPEDWVRREGLPERGDTASDADDPDPDPDLEPQAGAAGEPRSGGAGEGGAAAGHPSAAAEPRVSRGPYRPWFTAGEAPEPWFASEPSRPSPGPDD
jgi:hypothetical protein